MLTTGWTSFVTITSSKALQVPFVTVQRTVALVPAATAVMVVVGELGVVIVAEPLINVHTPVPGLGALCVIVKVLVLHWVWLGWLDTTG